MIIKVYTGNMQTNNMSPVALSVLIWTSLLCSEVRAKMKGQYYEYGDATIVYSSLIEPPFLYNTSDYHTGRRYSGFIPDLVRIISERLERPYQIILVPYEGYGVPDARSPGGWTGLIGDVISGKADVAAAPLTATFSREAVVDFTTKFMDSGIAALYLYRNSLDGSGWPSVIDSPLYFADKGVEIICINGSLSNYYIESEKRNDSPVGNVLRHMLIDRPKRLVRTKDEGIRRVLETKGESVFFLEKPFADHIAANELGCRLKATTGVINAKKAKHYAFAVRKGYPLLESINIVMNSLASDGTLATLRHQWWQGKCSVKTDNVEYNHKPRDNYIDKKPRHHNTLLMNENMVSQYLGCGNKSTGCMLHILILFFIHVWLSA